MPTRSTALLVVLLLLSAIPAAAQTFVFDLRGSQEVPPVPSTASGGCMGQLDQPAATFTITCAHNVVGATVAHIHRAPAGANGEIVFDLGDPASPVTATWTAMTPTNISDLLAGNLYLNIHTAGRPAGEIRGQIVNNVDAVAFTANGAQVVPPNDSSATASCTGDLNSGATSLAINCTHNLAGASAAHVHDAPFGQVGPVVFTFPGAGSPLNASIPMTPLLVAKYAATFLYLDIHTPGGSEEAPSDEIRGQIGTPPAGAGTGTIVIVKNTYPSGGTGFGFTDTIEAPNAFTLDDGGTRTFASVEPGTYTVTENDPSASGFTLGDVSCDDGDSTGDPFARAATIRVDAGETVTCRFRNLETAPTDDLFVFHLSGDQEVPPVVTTERGGCMGRFDSGANALTLLCTHDVNLPTVMHIHRGAVGAIGDVAFDLGAPDSPVIATWSGMTSGDVADLFAGNFYVNIHTSGRPLGAIRGQILPSTVDTVSFTMDAPQVVPPGDSPYTGNCTANLDEAATGLAVSCTHNLPSPDQAHVHRAPRGQNGPLVYTFPSAASPFASTVPMTPRAVADFAATFLYVEVHQAESGEEETAEAIRGQIAEPVVLPTTGTIRIVKSTSPAGGTGFTFTDDVPGSAGTFALDHGEVQTFTDVVAGTYTIAESPTATHSLANVSCSDADSTGDPFARTATVRLQAGEVVTCTFTNLETVASPQTFVFHLSGSQEVPPSGSTARGGCFAQFDSGAGELAIVCTHDVSGPVIAHIHRGAAGAIGDIAFDLGDPLSPIVATWSGMTPADVTALLSGNLYVNIHAGGRPEGEIRGQILPRTVDAFSFYPSGAQEVPPTDSTRTGDCFADLAGDATSVLVRCTHNVPSPSSTHLHAAPPGADGPVVFDFPNTRTFESNVPLTPRLVADFAAGFLYVNIHSLPDYEQGEIRGQLIAGTAPAHLQHVPTASEWALALMVLSLTAMAWWRMRG
ncbi:MAG TPA: CHRD domain-containing protein [Thermoanaerobaculia bacterium]